MAPSKFDAPIPAITEHSTSESDLVNEQHQKTALQKLRVDLSSPDTNKVLSPTNDRVKTAANTGFTSEPKYLHFTSITPTEVKFTTQDGASVSDQLRSDGTFKSSDIVYKDGTKAHEELNSKGALTSLDVSYKNGTSLQETFNTDTKPETLAHLHFDKKLDGKSEHAGKSSDLKIESKGDESAGSKAHGNGGANSKTKMEAEAKEKSEGKVPEKSALHMTKHAAANGPHGSDMEARLAEIAAANAGLISALPADQQAPAASRLAAVSNDAGASSSTRAELKSMAKISET